MIVPFEPSDAGEVWVVDRPSKPLGAESLTSSAVGGAGATLWGETVGGCCPPRKLTSVSANPMTIRKRMRDEILSQ